jgi:hypothetical protein
MVRVFGLLIALAMSTGVANAALLASWSFTNPGGTTSSAGTVAGGVTATAGNFTNFGTPTAVNGTNGSVQSSTWRTAAINTSNTGFSTLTGNEFTLTNSSGAPPKTIQIDNVAFNAEVMGSGDETTTVRVRVYTSLNGGAFSEATSFVNVGIGSFGTLNTVALNRTLTAGDSLAVRLVYSGRKRDGEDNLISAIANLDNITLNGSDNVVPEPASMACFAGLFAVGALRRLRKRS